MKSQKWTDDDVAILKENYARIGKQATAFLLNRPEASIRWKAGELGLKLDTSSKFWKEFQKKAAASKVGKKRPDQAAVLNRLRAEGKLVTTDTKRKKLSIAAKKRLVTHGHAKGMLGKCHSQETKDAIGRASQEQWNNMSSEQSRQRSRKIVTSRHENGTLATVTRGSWKAAWNEIGGKRKFFRSRWEANYARYLEWLKQGGEIRDWEHEPKVFWFEGIRRGCVSYLPDFSVETKTGELEYHEVKGWMDARSKTKIKRMAKYFPSVKLIVIDSKFYRSLDKTLRNVVPGWEVKGRT